MADRRWAIRWEPRDIWVGLYWDRKADGLHFYVCLVPCVVLHVGPRRTDLEEQLIEFGKASVREEVRAGQALLGLVEQIERLRKNPCPAMGFGFDHDDIASAVESEVAEVRAEIPGSRPAKTETAGVLATALHLVIVHGSDPVEAIGGETEKLRRRLDVVEAGGTWAEAKALDRAGGGRC